MNLKGRVALVTGGAGHIGSAMAETLAELGAKIVLLDVHQELCQKKANEIHEKYQVETWPCIVDLTQEEQTRAVPGFIRERFGRLDICVNCAALVGTSHLKGWAVPLEDQSVDTWRMALEVNLTSVFVLVQACHEILKSSKRGSVINVSSIYGMVGPDMNLYQGTGMGNPAAYSASKGGLLQLTRWLATVLAPDIRVNAISLGGVFRNHQEPFLTRYVQRTPLGRMATEEDIKGAAAYLAGDLSSYVTGDNLVVDGGWTAW